MSSRAVWRSCLLLLTLPAALPAQAPTGRYVVLVTLDGVRTEEFFAGMDTIVSGRKEDSGIYDSARVRRDYWRETPEARRRALMPFFWDSLAPRGMVFGNRTRGSVARITNGQGFSAPGYQEMLTGQAQADVTSNDPVRYPHLTALEYARHALGLGMMQVAVFGSWENFRFYAASREGQVYVNAGYDRVPEPFTSPELARLGVLQTRALALWEGSRLDAFTGAMALEYMRLHRPRVVYIAMNDTDDLAHSRRYDRLLDALHATDDFLRDLWHAVERQPAYRGRTTLILTTDHGRGRTPADWTDHGAEVPGSEDIWLAIIGPGTPRRGEVSSGREIHQADVAATLLACLGLDPARFNPAGGPPVPGACEGLPVRGGVPPS